MKKILAFLLALTFVFSIVQTVPASAAQRVAVTSVKLNVTGLKWAIGQSGTYKVTIAPSNATNKAVSWKSGNVKVATINSAGKVKAVGTGSTTITCTSKDNSTKKATCSITVVKRVAATPVKLNVNSLRWAVGQSGTYTVTVLPANATNKAVSWKSGNVKVATINSAGKVTAVGYGSTTITCTSKDNTTKKATCSIKVGKKATSVKLSSTSMKLGLGKTGKIIATVGPTDAINKAVSWKSANTKVATVDSTGTVTAVASGTTIVTCTTKDGSGLKTSCAVVIGNSTLGGILSYMFNAKDGYFYTESDPWQRQFGFNALYDWGAPLFVMYYSTVRINFNYNGLDWMVQMWKGQYGFAFIGSEIGVYTKPEDRDSDHYDSASNDNALKIGMTLYKGDTKLFSRPYDTYWWSTGFVPGSLTRYADRTELTMTARITLKDEAMKDSFIQAIEGCGFSYGTVANRLTIDTYTVRGNDVYFNWKNIEQ